MNIYNAIIEAVVLESQVAVDPKATPEQKALQRATYIAQRLTGGGLIDQPLVLTDKGEG